MALAVCLQRKWRNQGLGASEGFSVRSVFLGLRVPVFALVTRQRLRFQVLPTFQDAFASAEAYIVRH